MPETVLPPFFWPEFGDPMTEDHKMTGAQLNAIRMELGLTFEQFARALGMTGKNSRDTLRKMVRGYQPVTPRIARASRELVQSPRD